MLVVPCSVNVVPMYKFIVIISVDEFGPTSNPSNSPFLAVIKILRSVPAIKVEAGIIVNVSVALITSAISPFIKHK